MKRVLLLGAILTLITDLTLANPNRDIQALKAIRDAGELAFSCFFSCPQTSRPSNRSGWMMTTF